MGRNAQQELPIDGQSPSGIKCRARGPGRPCLPARVTGEMSGPTAYRPQRSTIHLCDGSVFP